MSSKIKMHEKDIREKALLILNEWMLKLENEMKSEVEIEEDNNFIDID